MSIVYLKPAGIIDADEGKSLLSRVQAALDSGITGFHLDCSDVHSIDEQELGHLLQAFKLITEAQGRLLIFSINESVHSFLAELGLDLIFEIYP
ncbi:MAG: STAS domain-containing protein [Thermosynechococcaceae cyanobacterium MS004]|nr:STAS domain-containing protein [Thermosynechococcaceae cyanobacterium MS004]